MLAAFTASFVGGDRKLRRPVAGGAVLALVASVATWFIAIGVIGALGGPGLDVQAATGLLAVAVLLVVMNWFFHKIYWTGWISAHNKKRRSLHERPGRRSPRAARARAARLHRRSTARASKSSSSCRTCGSLPGSNAVLEGVALGLALTVAVGIVTFSLQQRLPYKRMLVVTGALLGFVLLVMVGESIQEMQLAGWLPAHTIGVTFPGFVGLWFAVFPTVEGILAQVTAAALVLGSYFLAEHLRVQRPRARAEQARAPQLEALSEHH